MIGAPHHGGHMKETTRQKYQRESKELRGRFLLEHKKIIESGGEPNIAMLARRYDRTTACLYGWLAEERREKAKAGENAA
jgi:hypothetical protein